MANSHLRRRIAMISHCFRKGSNLEVLRLFRQMQYEGLPPNRFILPILLRSASNLSDTSTGRFLHSFAIRSLLTPDPFISSAFIEFYSKHGRIKDARRVFDETPEKDLVVWNSMVSGYACCGLLEEGTSLFRKMQSGGPKPDLLTWNSLISGFSQSGYEQKALKLFDSMRSTGIEADVYSWTCLISGSVRNFNYRRAFLLFRQMVGVARINPNAATISSLLPASANVMNLRRGREIHGFSVVAGVEHDLFVSTSLVDMYGKCGVISDAEKVFDHMPERRNTVSWNSMVFAYANHGCCKKAIQLFNQMEIYGATPDHLTFTAVLAACSHTGMVQLGNHFFWLMQECHGISPKLEHYACMVDLLGRAGKVFEAYDLISGMPMEPDFFVWGALLGACRLHVNVKLSKIAAGHLNELEPKSAASCLLLSGVLMNDGMLGDAEKIKQLLRKRKFTRYVGCSWTQAASLRLCD